MVQIQKAKKGSFKDLFIFFIYIFLPQRGMPHHCHLHTLFLYLFILNQFEQYVGIMVYIIYDMLCCFGNPNFLSLFPSEENKPNYVPTSLLHRWLLKPFCTNKQIQNGFSTKRVSSVKQNRFKFYSIFCLTQNTKQKISMGYIVGIYFTFSINLHKQYPSYYLQ